MLLCQFESLIRFISMDHIDEAMSPSRRWNEMFVWSNVCHHQGEGEKPRDAGASV